MRFLKKTNFLLLIKFTLLGFIIIACADKEITYNKPASFWYEGIYKNIRLGDLDAADSYFSSLQSEHINSPFLQDAMILLGQAHMQKKEQLLAEFYFNEYLKRYGNSSNADYISYLKLQSRYYSLHNSAKDQSFITTSLLQVQDFLQKYPSSRYIPYVQYMEVKFTLGQNELNKAVARVYKGIDKEQARNLYLERVDSVLEEETNPVESKIPWYLWILNW